MKKVFLIFSISCCGLVLLSGCARNISSNTYDARTLGGESLDSYPCKVVSVRKIMVEEGDYLENSQTGTVLGAVAGGVAGNMIGQGKGRVLATGIGAVAGAVGGALAEKSLKSQEAYEYIVELRDGRMKTVVQGLDTVLAPGQEALLIEGRRGRSRLVAR